MKLEMFFDMMFDAINEAEGLPVKEIDTDFQTNTFVVQMEDGSVFEVNCAKKRN